jgi:hypothetical protein
MRQCWKRRAARAPTAVSPARSPIKLACDITVESAKGLEGPHPSGAVHKSEA